ncbi:hypothetical protein L3X38_032946 [Prunus dulcis]|uniref:Uncharacterized protein n=1 Tax=Prunus dulcis TaxID=3755 RepID=A0AAD4YX53_PRUDU|nr:hypothetical protein L3X38_032946 [Prunus dulcis]
MKKALDYPTNICTNCLPKLLDKTASEPIRPRCFCGIQSLHHPGYLFLGHRFCQISIALASDSAAHTPYYLSNICRIACCEQLSKIECLNVSDLPLPLTPPPSTFLQAKHPISSPPYQHLRMKEFCVFFALLQPLDPRFELPVSFFFV